MIKRWRIGLLGVVVTALAIYFLLSQVDVTRLASALTTARYIYLLPCIVLLVAGLVTRALRWQVLLSGGLPLKRAFSILNVTYLVNGLLPLRIGELARAYLATRSEPPVAVFKSVSTIITERLLDLLAVIVLLTLALSAGPLPDQLRAFGLVTGPIALVGFLVLVLLAKQRQRSERLLAWLMERIPALRRLNVMAFAAHFLDGLAPLTRLSTLAQALGWTVLSWALSVAAGYVLMFAFYERADWAVTFMYIAAAAFAVAVPAVPGNVGPYEAAIVLALSTMDAHLLQPLGEASATAAAFALVVHGVNVAVYAVTGIIGFIQEGVSLAQLSRGVQDIRHHTRQEM
ncbi:MAG: flippase-like domain-containing protein [Burkholderiales bacterium]|nr:flippase-like domain-containing protein [Anaerolineae bacterium]